MKDCLLFLGFREPFSLHSDTVQQLGPGNGLKIFKYTGEMKHVMPVNRTEISEFECLKQVALFKDSTLDAALKL
ncbi:MAG: hypothetical protein BWY89_01406 [Bacteroidetes bacterium ADurb.BinA012]|nr:MAG: hypothetical protein BWY89_01406 [Bacteroidetes bacterium ADurb.BinA012]